MYKVKTDTENRIVQIQYTETPGPDVIEEYPGSPINDYKLIDGKVIHDPLPPVLPPDPNAPTQNDKIEAQVTYTAMKSNTLILEQQPMMLLENDNSQRQELNQNIQKWYRQHLWTETMVNEAVEKGILTQEELINLSQKGGNK